MSIICISSLYGREFFSATFKTKYIPKSSGASRKTGVYFHSPLLKAVSFKRESPAMSSLHSILVTFQKMRFFCIWNSFSLALLIYLRLAKNAISVLVLFIYVFFKDQHALLLLSYLDQKVHVINQIINPDFFVIDSLIFVIKINPVRGQLILQKINTFYKKISLR